MATTIRIRDVPADVHRRLKARAALDGLFFSQFVLREATRVAAHPTMAEMRSRLDTLPRQPELRGRAASALREEQEQR